MISFSTSGLYGVLYARMWDIVYMPFEYCSGIEAALGGGEWSASRPCRLTLRKYAPVPTGYEAGWASEPVWTIWRRVKSVAATGYRTPAPRWSSLIIVPTELLRLL
jgi:hypothetical protein